MEAINSGPMINKLVAAADRINAPSSLELRAACEPLRAT
jgi:hypothetical protein